MGYLLYENPHFIIFASRSGARYIYDAATITVHPLYWQFLGEQLAEIYAAEDDEGVKTVVEKYGISSSFYNYVVKWRREAHAFAAIPHNRNKCNSTPADRHHLSWVPSPSALSNLILVLTRNCNLRCSYCIYSGHYDGFPLLDKSIMPWETAKKAVDNFFLLNDTAYFNSIGDRKLDIGFYGGEPLLRSDLLKKVVNYARSIYRLRHKLHFSFTSNLTHLSDEMARFMVKNSIGVQCSLDGPEDEHDRYRRFASGKGTFKVVRRNLERLRSLDEDYFNKYVQVLVTINGNTDLEAVMRFFDDPKTKTPAIAFVNTIRSLSTGNFHKKHPYDPKRLEKLNNKVLDEYFYRKRKRIPVPQGSFLYHFIEDSLLTTYGRIMKLGDSCATQFTGACQPGRRLTVSPDGNFHMCERITEDFAIGNVQEGLNFEKCLQVMKKYYSSLPSCQNCWARGLCHLCFAVVCHNGSFRFTEAECKLARAIVFNRLKLLYSVLEEAHDSLVFGDPIVDRYKFSECK